MSETEDWERLLFRSYTREAWSQLGKGKSAPLESGELEAIRALSDVIDEREVDDVYLPLCWLLEQAVANAERLQAAIESGAEPVGRRPFIIGIAGSVAIGKSTTARLLRAILSRGRPANQVELVTTDGFLYPKAELERRGILDRKGFPESYDLHALVAFLAAIQRGEPEVSAPTYSHLSYDIVPGERQVLRAPRILILEGLNVLQTPQRSDRADPPVFVSDFFDFSLYVHAREADIQRWYVERFHLLRERVFDDPESFFHRYSQLSTAEATEVALDLWKRINAPNLRQNIAPTRARANAILNRGGDRRVDRVLLR